MYYSYTTKELLSTIQSKFPYQSISKKLKQSAYFSLLHVPGNWNGKGNILSEINFLVKIMFFFYEKSQISVIFYSRQQLYSISEF